MSTRVLVTGATTPIGRALVDDLLADPATEHVLAVAAEAPADAFPSYDERLVYVQADLTRPRRIHELLFGPARELGIRSMVHTALHRRAADRGRRIRALNVESTRELLRLAERHPTIDKLVYRGSADVYQVEAEQPVLLDEEHPLRFTSFMPQYLRDRVEADVMVCTRMGLSPLRIVALRCCEILAPDSGSQLFDYLSSRVCFRPLGYDPMLHVMTVRDAVRVTRLALASDAQGVFNVPGKDVLPLSAAIDLCGRVGIAVPGPALAPLYGMRAAALRTDFRWDLNEQRFHFSGVVDGRRAERVLGYVPQTGVDWSEIAVRALL
ncbi:MAG: NAD-dependent epimerase/dehydratase family protein [Polyangiales bacterium]